MSEANQEKIISYSYMSEGKKLESMYSYAYLKDGVYFSLGDNLCVRGVTDKLKMWGYQNPVVIIELETDFYKRTSDLGKITEVNQERFNEVFNCLPPLRHYNSTSYEIFMLSEEIAAGYFSFFVRVDGRFFEMKEHFKKSFSELQTKIFDHIKAESEAVTA